MSDEIGRFIDEAEKHVRRRETNLLNNLTSHWTEISDTLESLGLAAKILNERKRQTEVVPDEEEERVNFLEKRKYRGDKNKG